MILKQVTLLLENHLLDSHPKRLAQLLSILSNNIVCTVVQNSIVRYFIQIAFNFLKKISQV